MRYRLLWTARARKDLKKLDPQNRSRVVKGLERFAESGEGDLVRLTDVEPPEWRLRVGPWRVRLAIDAGAAALEIYRIRHRDKAY